MKNKHSLFWTSIKWLAIAIIATMVIMLILMYSKSLGFYDGGT